MLLLADGFDQYGATSSLALAYTILGDCFQCVNRNPRTGSGSLTWRQGSTNADYFLKLLPSNPQQIFMGFAINFQTLVDTFNSQNFFSLDILDNTGVLQMRMQLTNPDGRMQFLIGGVVVMTTSYHLTANKYCYIEIGLKIDPVSGTLEVRVDGDSINVFVGPTQTGALNIGQVKFAGARVFGTPDFDIDDWYICEPSGNTFNNFLGPIHCRTLLPNNDTVNADWAVTGAASGNQAVGLLPANIAGRYIQASAIGNETDFTYPNIPATAYAILGVIVGAFAQQTVAGSTTITVGLNSNGVTQDSAPFALSTNPLFSYNLFNYNPELGANWVNKTVNLLRTRLIRTA